MARKRKIHSPEFKTKVALEAIKGFKTTSELASQFQVHPTQISAWKKQARTQLPEVFKRVVAKIDCSLSTLMSLIAADRQAILSTYQAHDGLL